MPEVKKDVNQTISAQESGLGMLFRIFWMFLGNVILLIFLVWIFENENKSLGIKDVIYWVIVCLLIITRYIDIKKLGGLTITGSSASMSVWYRYAVFIAILAGLLWGLAHITKYILS
jgi:hypothetical protein